MVIKLELMNTNLVAISSESVRARIGANEIFNESGNEENKGAGFESYIYELSARAHFALVFDQVNVNRFIENAGENEVLETLAALASFIQSAHF